MRCRTLKHNIQVEAGVRNVTVYQGEKGTLWEKNVNLTEIMTRYESEDKET